MTIRTTTLRPGLLVSLKTSVRGNVSYERKDLAHKLSKDGTEVTDWETHRTISDLKEYEAAGKARTAALIAVRRVCAYSAFGLLCPEEKAGDLESAMKEARKIANDFNESAKLTHVSVNVITGRIAQDDVEAVRAINSEVRDLLSDMEIGLKNLDVKKVREAANKATSVGKMLSDEASDRLKIALDAARSSARRIVKAGENVTVEIDRSTIKTIARQRTAFLDLDDANEVGMPKATARAVDLSDEDKAYNEENRKRSREMDAKRRKEDREATPAYADDE